MVSYNPGAKKALFSKGRDLYICDFPAPRVAMKDKVTFKNLVAPVSSQSKIQREQDLSLLRRMMHTHLMFAVMVDLLSMAVIM